MTRWWGTSKDRPAADARTMKVRGSIGALRASNRYPSGKWCMIRILFHPLDVHMPHVRHARGPLENRVLGMQELSPRVRTVFSRFQARFPSFGNSGFPSSNTLIEGERPLSGQSERQKASSWTQACLRDRILTDWPYLSDLITDERKVRIGRSDDFLARTLPSPFPDIFKMCPLNKR